MTAALAACLASTVQAAEPGDRDANREDVRCVIGMSVMSRNETYKAWGLNGVFYYSGRIEGRDPGVNLAEAIKREVRTLQPGAYNDLIRGCSDKLAEKSRAFEAMKPPAPRGVGR